MTVPVRRVVVTGLGVITPLGLGAEALDLGLHEGRSGIRPISSFDTANLTTRFAGEVLGFDAKQYIDKKDRKSLRVMARGIQMAVAAAQLALDHGAVDKAKLDPTRFGVEFGSGLLATELPEIGPAAQVSSNCQPGSVDLRKWGEQGLAVIPPLWMLKYLPNMLACHVSILHNAQGPNNSITESDVAGLLALEEAARILRRDQADFFLVGGAESKVNPLSMVRQCLFGHLSRRNDAPERACRPFERDRDGMVIGEGAGVLAVEDLGHARARGARIWAEVVGCGAAFDRGCTGAGIARAAHAAFRQAGIGPDDLDHVNAHGLGSVKADAWEARGIRQALGDADVPVWAVKSAIGNLGAGCGTTELAASILALHRGTLPASLNYQDPDPACPVRLLAEPRPVRKPYFLKIGFTDMGQTAAVVCRKWDE